MTKRLFESAHSEESRTRARVKRALIIPALTLVFLAVWSGYRAAVQVRSLELRTDGEILRGGSVVETTVVSYGRTYVDVRVELIQGAHTETLAIERVPKNRFASIDPRTRRAVYVLTLKPEMLARFETGAARVRATARGRPQWLRTPAPLVRELASEIRR